MNTYCIYKATNKKNGKSYIGRTKNLGQRIRQHINTCEKKDNVFHKDLYEFGYKNFTWEILELTDVLQEAKSFEREYIELFDTVAPNGYNMTQSGAGGIESKTPIIMLTLDGEFVERFDNIMSATKKGYDKSSIYRCLFVDHKTCRGHLFMTEEDYMKNGAKKYRKPISSQKRAVIQCDLQGNYISEFESLSDASDSTGTSRTSISGNLSKRYKSANGFIWVYKEDFPIKDMSVYKATIRGTKVAQIDKNTGEIIEVFDRIVDAAKKLGVDHRNIQKVMNIPGHTAYGYMWKPV